MCGYTLVVVLASSCTSVRRPLPEFRSAAWGGTKQTTVQVFEPSGAPAGDPVVVGKDPMRVGKFRPNPWSGVHEAVHDASGEDTANASADSQGDKALPNPGEVRPPAMDRQNEGAQNEGSARGSGTDQDEPYGAPDLYELFGPRIVIHRDGTLSKAYFVQADASAMLRSILAIPEPAGEAAKNPAATRFVLKRGSSEKATILDTLMGQSEVTIDIIAGFETLNEYPLGDKTFATAFPNVAKGTVPNAPDTSSDLILVTGKPDGISAFEQAMDLFYRSVPQILIEAKVVEFSYGETLDLGVSAAGTDPTVRTVGKGSFVQSIVSRFPNASVGTNAPEGILTLGGIHDNLELNVALEMLQTRAKSDIVSNPRIAVRNGGTAVIDTRTRLPYPEARISGQNVTTNIKFLDVGVSMQIRPDVTPGDSVRLQIFASVDAINGFAATEPIPTPQISSRVARTSVHVPSGKTTVIGGLITKNRFENESMLPILGDIPVLGWLFRSTNIQESRNEVVFFITPRIIYGFQGSDPEDDFPGGGF
ncbi:MAG: type II and III secretion system protein [Planctomycetes bacterium]|nr:type II and III secretion system protein [Planctomycetota bacterium]MCB9918382.1 type II and III secretion system protein [Planctomycetota bacterium]